MGERNFSPAIGVFIGVRLRLHLGLHVKKARFVLQAQFLENDCHLPWIGACWKLANMLRYRDMYKLIPEAWDHRVMGLDMAEYSD